MEISEERARRWLTEAEGYLELGLFDQALERLQRLSGTQRFRLERALLSGSLYRERGDYATAVPSFEEALRQEPGNVPATIGLGWCLKRLGRLEQAIGPYVEAIKRQPNVGVLHYNLACYLSLLGRAEQALQALDRAFALDESFKELAGAESDFDPIKELPAFRKKVRGT